MRPRLGKGTPTLRTKYVAITIRPHDNHLNGVNDCVDTKSRYGIRSKSVHLHGVPYLVDVLTLLASSTHRSHTCWLRRGRWPAVDPVAVRCAPSAWCEQSLEQSRQVFFVVSPESRERCDDNVSILPGHTFGTPITCACHVGMSLTWTSHYRQVCQDLTQMRI